MLVDEKIGRGWHESFSSHVRSFSHPYIRVYWPTSNPPKLNGIVPPTRDSASWSRNWIKLHGIDDNTRPSEQPSLCPTPTIRGTCLLKLGSPFQNPGVEKKLVSLANDFPPNVLKQFGLQDVLGSSNMMLSGLNIVTRNRFV